MNGLQVIDLKESSFMDNLLRREPRENAFVEINNLLASVPILQLDRASIENCLEKYGVSNEKATSRLTNFYSIILRYFVKDFELSNLQIQKLQHLQRILLLENEDLSRINSAILHPIYQNYVRNAVADGNLFEEEKEKLKRLSRQLGVSKRLAKNMYAKEAKEYLHSVLKQSLSDGMLSKHEENELKRIADALQVKFVLTENAEENLRRYRYLWQLYIGNLPQVSTPIHLEKEEFCAAFVNATHHEIGNAHHPVKYSGYNQLGGISKTGFQSGRVPTRDVKGKTARFLDQGTLYFTNERLLFNGTNGTISYTLKNLIGATFYPNGMLVEQYRGRDQFFRFKGDVEALKLIFDSLITKSRRN